MSDDVKEIVKSKENLDRAYTQFIDGAIFASELMARVIELQAYLNAFQIKGDIEETSQ